MKAVVIKSTGSWYSVLTKEEKNLKCRIKGKFRLQGIRSTNPVVVGDNVIIKKEGKDWNIVDLLERKNYVIRKSVNLSKQIHILAANIDLNILMVTLKKPITSTEFIDRFLITLEAYDIPTLILFNKIDLCSEEELEEFKKVKKIYMNIGYNCFLTSLKKGKIDFLRVQLKDKITMIAGHSGVGKSTLINILNPSLKLKTAQISEYHSQGKHSTTFAEMFSLQDGGYIIDTPGIRGFGLVNIGINELGDYFPEIFDLRKRCRFNNCTHLKEPNCAVLNALEKKYIAKSRYNSYLSILSDTEETYR